MKISNRQSDRATRPAFTLVEMLVSVTLVLLMMTMFASIFQVAMNSFKTQQALGESDQKARALTTLIRADFAKRTMRYPLAFYPGEDLDLGPKSPGLREGYVYISTNDPDSRFDDFIQFTVRSDLVAQSTDTTEYFGAAQPLIDRQGGATAVNLFQNPNQPEVDDGSLSADFASSSPAAQIAYFIRNGNLYRRVVLIRNPRRVAGGELSSQPTSTAGNNFFSGYDDAGNYDGQFQIAGGTFNRFHRFFDFSAIADSPVPPVAGQRIAKFIGIESLSNKLAASGAAFEAFGNPIYRFGFNQSTGFSREHDSNSTRNFLGRFTHAETSAPNFTWPMAAAASNPYNLGNGVSLIPGDDLVGTFSGTDGLGGPRRMEDLVMANVNEFAIEIWDERAGRFVVPGYGSLTDPDAAVGDYHIRRNLHADVAADRFSYGPLAPYDASSTVDVNRQPHVFDTWHPVVGAVNGGARLDFDGDGNREMSEVQAPYTAYLIYPPRQNDTQPGPCSHWSPQTAIGSSLGNGLRYRGYWSPATSYVEGDVVFAVNGDWSPNGGWDANGDGAFHWILDAPAVPNQAFQTAYRCVAIGDEDSADPAGTSSASAVGLSFPETPGKRMTDKEVVWESFDNRRPLKAARLTIRFINEKSGEPRQLTLVLPLTDE